MHINRSHLYLSLLFLVAIAFSSVIKPHGFGGHTLVKAGDGACFWSIEQVVQCVGEGEKLHAASYDQDANQWIKKRVTAAGFSEANCYCRLSLYPIAQTMGTPKKEPFDQGLSRPLECTPTQLFYRLDDRKWIAAYMLRIGDLLLCDGGQTIEVADITLINKPLKVYTLEVRDTHTFLVTERSIVAHNMLVPVATAIGFSVPLHIGCDGASLGALMGPVGLVGGVVIGGVIGYLINACIKSTIAEYELSFKPRAIATFMGLNRNERPLLKTVEDILVGTLPGRETAGKAKQYIKTGGYEDAMEDFESLEPKDIKSMVGKEGKVGILPDGRKVNVRVESHDGRPTLEIQPVGGKGKVIKIRYEENR